MTNKELEKRADEFEKKLEKLESEVGSNYFDICCLSEHVDDLMDKVFGEDCKTVSQPHHDFKVGDRVQFKSWEEMEKEFVVDGFGDIFIKGTLFSARMKHLCETYATITKIEKKYVSLKDFTANGDTDWNYTLDMLKPATDEPKYKFNVWDRVRVVAKGSHYGELVTIEELPQYSLLIYKVRDDNGQLNGYYEKDLEPYTEPHCKYKVFDRVVIKANRYIDTIIKISKFGNRYLLKTANNGEYHENEVVPCGFLFATPRWTFTDDEKVILRNLPKKWNWIARDDNGQVFVYTDQPIKKNIKEFKYWAGKSYIVGSCPLSFFNHLFQSIKWTDEEPCEFRKYL